MAYYSRLLASSFRNISNAFHSKTHEGSGRLTNRPKQDKPCLQLVYPSVFPPRPRTNWTQGGERSLKRKSFCNTPSTSNASKKRRARTVGRRSNHRRTGKRVAPHSDSRKKNAHTHIHKTGDEMDTPVIFALLYFNANTGRKCRLEFQRSLLRGGGARFYTIFALCMGHDFYST